MENSVNPKDAENFYTECHRIVDFYSRFLHHWVGERTPQRDKFIGIMTEIRAIAEGGRSRRTEPCASLRVCGTFTAMPSPTMNCAFLPLEKPGGRTKLLASFADSSVRWLRATAKARQ